MKKKLELCCYCLEAIELAKENEIFGIELCDNPKEGGTTPSFGIIKNARNISDFFLNVMIRPRGGNFVYSGSEFNTMKYDIQNAMDLGADGIVSGILDSYGKIDFKRTEILQKLCGSKIFTFHKAFDVSRNHDLNIEPLINIGVKRVLTSGGCKTALEGSYKIAEWIKSYGTRINFVPGGGVRAENIKEISEITGAFEFHTSAAKISKHDNNDNLYSTDYLTADTRELIEIMGILKKNDYSDSSNSATG